MFGHREASERDISAIINLRNRNIPLQPEDARTVTVARREFNDTCGDTGKTVDGTRAGRESLRLSAKRKRSGRAEAGVRQEAVGQGGNWKGKSVIKDRALDNFTPLFIIKGLLYCLHCVRYIMLQLSSLLVSVYWFYL